MSAYEDIVKDLAKIRAWDEARDDPERTHAEEDGVMVDGLRAIAAGDPDGRRIAAILVEHADNHMQRQDVVRWYA